MTFKEKLESGKVTAILPIVLLLSIIGWPLLCGAQEAQPKRVGVLESSQQLKADGKLYQFLAYVIDKSPGCESCPPQSVSVSDTMNANKNDPSVLTITLGSSPHIGHLVVGAQYRFYVKVYRVSNSLDLIYYEIANNQQPLNDYVAQKVSFSEFLQKFGDFKTVSR